MKSFLGAIIFTATIDQQKWEWPEKMCQLPLVTGCASRWVIYGTERQGAEAQSNTDPACPIFAIWIFDATSLWGIQSWSLVWQRKRQHSTYRKMSGEGTQGDPWKINSKQSGDIFRSGIGILQPWRLFHSSSCHMERQRLSFSTAIHELWINNQRHCLNVPRYWLDRSIYLPDKIIFGFQQRRCSNWFCVIIGFPFGMLIWPKKPGAAWISFSLFQISCGLAQHPLAHSIPRSYKGIQEKCSKWANYITWIREFIFLSSSLLV